MSEEKSPFEVNLNIPNEHVGDWSVKLFLDDAEIIPVEGFSLTSKSIEFKVHPNDFSTWIYAAMQVDCRGCAVNIYESFISDKHKFRLVCTMDGKQFVTQVKYDSCTIEVNKKETPIGVKIVCD